MAANNRRAVAFVACLLAACGSHTGGPNPTPVTDPPAITCPADVTVTGVTGTEQTVSYSPPTFTGGTTPVTVACSRVSGSLFSLGTTSVSCVASDSATRTASCSFNVTLRGLKIGVTKILTFGDSITEGQNGQRIALIDLVDVPNAYPTRLQSMFDASFPGQVSIANEGRGGERVEDGLARLPGVMAAQHPGAVLLMDGYNNLLADCQLNQVTSKCGGTIDFVAGKMRECVRIARSGGASYVFVGTVTPPGPYVPTPGYDDRRITGSAITNLNARLRSQLPAEGASVVDIYPLFLGHEPEYTSPDGLHLAPAGNQAVADAFFAAIKNAVPQTPLATAKLP